MRLVDYEERQARTELIDSNVINLDTGEWADLYAFPLFANIKSGEKVATGLSADWRVAPSEPGEYELWQVVHNNCHWRFEFRKV